MSIIIREDTNQCCIKEFSIFLAYNQNPQSSFPADTVLLFQLVFVSLD